MSRDAAFCITWGFRDRYRVVVRQIFGSAAISTACGTINVGCA
jgi:hypothetical protein